MRNHARNPQESEYVARVNRAIDFIVCNLSGTLRLEDVAREACFSRFHFHRIFQALTGETLNQFVKRLRLERALRFLAHDRRKTLTEIALACGFSSSSDFSRCFKQRFGVPPSVFDLETYRASHREELQDAICDGEHRHRLDRLPPGENPDGFEVELRTLPPRTVAYLRVADSFREGAVPGAARRLVEWAEERGFADGQWLGYMWDDPTVVSLADCRYDVAVEVDDVVPEGEIGRFEFPRMQVAQVEVRGAIDVEMRALDWLFGTWLPSSGCFPTEQPCFEAWIGRPFAHGLDHFELYAWLPVERG